MDLDIQTKLLNCVKDKLGKKDTVPNALSDLLCISMDAAYRRNRNETPFTIHEVQKICNHYGISLDALLGMGETNVMFNYNPTHLYDFSLEQYLEGMLTALKTLKQCTNPSFILTTNNLAIFQLLNFPRLSRFRLYFWAKTHLHIEEYREALHTDERVTETAFNLGAEILDLYVNIPTKECYDTEFLKGFIRQIQYYSNARLFEDPHYALKLMDDVKNMADHIKAQSQLGYKMKFRDDSKNIGAKYDVYLNDTINSDNSFYYSADEIEGIYLSHNQMNFLHTNDAVYVNETKSILEKQLANSSFISESNEKERNIFFHRIDQTIMSVRQKIELDIMSS
ncbi:BetR domain-containing protein [Lishizhenia tianjinensis]|uniref:BetR domain-containing protein n=1 Tax=Lishizhenia tianjinensis TaxID=477690 RepID=A0A1I6ZWK2_9FLAO|nr:helix-turn-helix domain-containing protein [Lishizhenia tianjinensis]SFT67080.1 BetR domain-containing protein [Lishizhenia tianjinensis]